MMPPPLEESYIWYDWFDLLIMGCMIHCNCALYLLKVWINDWLLKLWKLFQIEALRGARHQIMNWYCEKSPTSGGFEQ